MDHVAEPEGVEAQFAGGLEVQVRVVPEGVGLAVLAVVAAVELAEVGVERDEAGLELELEVEAETVAVDLGVVVEVVLHLVVLDAGVGERVEADGRPAVKAGVEADLIVRVEVVVEEGWLGHPWRAGAPGW